MGHLSETGPSIHFSTLSPWNRGVYELSLGLRRKWRKKETEKRKGKGKRKEGREKVARGKGKGAREGKDKGQEVRGGKQLK